MGGSASQARRRVWEKTNLRSDGLRKGAPVEQLKRVAFGCFLIGSTFDPGNLDATFARAAGRMAGLHPTDDRLHIQPAAAIAADTEPGGGQGGEQRLHHR